MSKTHVVSFSGGRTSAYLVHLMEQRRKADSEPVASNYRKLFTCTGCGAEGLDEPLETNCHCCVDGAHWVESRLYRHAQPAKMAPDCANAEFGTYSGQIAVLSPNGKAAGIDACMLSEVLGLWEVGITTIESCCGHNKVSSYIAVVEEDAGKMRALGYELDESHPSCCVFYSKTSRHGRVTQPAPALPDFDNVLESLDYEVRCNAWESEHVLKACQATYDACRAAMLQAEPVTTANKLGNSPVIPDGYVMVPKVVTPEIGNAINEVGHRCTCGNCSQRLWDLLLAAAPQEVK